VKGKLFNSVLNFVIVVTGVQRAIAATIETTTSVVSKDVTVFA
jgi:hypothetical protein